ncbi:MAG: hypothetical protein H6622_02665 [Halobacteriovoraceae bacterium]|nr:hypothetical protein [Halobacteriovoraceae bacterium]
MKKLFLSINIAVLSILSISTTLHADDVFEYRSFNKKGQVKSKRKYKKKHRIKEKVSTEKKFEVSAAYMQADISFENIEMYDAKGIGLSAGRIFYLGNGFKTTSSLIIDYASAKFSNSTINNFLERSNIDLTLAEIGLSQKFGYEIGIHSFKIVPFISPNLFYGSISAQDLFGNTSSENFYRYGANLGINFDFSNNISPFASYNFSKIKLDSMSDTADYKSLVIGIAFRF